MPRSSLAVLLLAAVLSVSACRQSAPLAVPPPSAPAVLPLVPLPAAVEQHAGPAFVFTPRTRLLFSGDGARNVAAVLAGLLGPEAHAGVDAVPASVPDSSVVLRLSPDASLGPEGYRLTVAATGIVLEAHAAAGLFYGVQTLRQLLPVSVEHPAALGRQFTVPAVRIEDRPRFAWRGAMLDVARHFRPPADVKHFIDAMALHKLNRLHLHLSDDQGWRLEIRAWPDLTRLGGRTEVGGGAGGFYTQDEYRDLVAYAAARYITVVPEFDVPGHTNAALASYPELNCDGIAPPPYTGIRVGFSALCPEKEVTWRFLDDVFGEVAALTPGPYLHVGGDEVEKLSHPTYLRFVERLEGIVRGHGKRMVGWGEIAPARLSPDAIVQHWRRDSSAVAVARGSRVVLSPSSRVYLDMKYDEHTPLGLKWAGYIPVETAYAWDPATWIEGVPEASVFGVEAPLWTETITTRQEAESMLFPRLAAVAEVGWTPQARRAWPDFRARLGAFGARYAALGLNFYRTPEVDWQ